MNERLTLPRNNRRNVKNFMIHLTRFNKSKSIMKTSRVVFPFLQFAL